MKKVFVLFGLLAFAFTVSAQDVPEKYSKIEDYELTKLSPSLNYIMRPRIRKLITIDDTKFSYQIVMNSVNDTYNDVIISMTKDEIKEARAALNTLVQKSNIDLTSKAEYLQNDYIFESGFIIGYEITKGRLLWTLSQIDGGIKHTYYTKTINEIVKSFSEATIIIEQLEKE